MTANRQDAWSHEDDLQLAETVLRHIREGSTQLAAFEEIADKLSRTSAACGFRWNSAIRKKYEAEVALAKKKRTALKREQSRVQMKKAISEEVIAPEKEEQPVSKAAPALKQVNLEDVIEFLKSMKDSEINKDEAALLKQENEKLKEQLVKIENEKKLITQDYRSLLEIMDRARKLANPSILEKSI